MMCFAPICIAQDAGKEHVSAPQLVDSAPKQTFENRWWKGNLHTHTFWSDGNDFPEMVAAWYADRDYNFLALTDHNILSRNIRWMSLEQIENRGGKLVLDRYRSRFGDGWVESRDSAKGREVRLKPLDEIRGLVERSGEFIMIEGEEISDKAEGKPIHINATNLANLIQPAGGATVSETIRNNLRTIIEQERETGRQILPHLNHPNFGYAVTAADLAVVLEERFFEVYNGHPGVNHLGDEQHIGIEPMWDVINVMRLVYLNSPPIYGIATDDSHEYHGRPGSRPGRGWVMVRAKYLSPEHIILAMKGGDFYSSSGVVLSALDWDQSTKRLSLAIQPAEGVNYETHFLVVDKPDPNSIDDSVPLHELVVSSLPQAYAKLKVKGNSAEYQLDGTELYVRAVVFSDRAPVDPVWPEQLEQAWTQPVGWTLSE
ncbi:PHP domain-containing protein [Pirellulaceae bacterium SH449]